MVWVNEGVNVGLVSLVLETEEQWQEWGLDEPGFLVCLDISGRTLTQDLFVSEEEFEREGIGLLNHAEAAQIKQLFSKVCEIDSAAENESFGVLRHKAHVGIPWIFHVGGRDAKATRYYGIVKTGEIKSLTKAQVFTSP